MSRVNRKSQRIDIAIDARVLSSSAEELCKVRNFCQGGLFIDYDGMESSNGQWRPRRGEAVEIAFEVPLNGSGQETQYNLSSRVAHITSSGFGVSFDKPELSVWYALMQARRESLTESRPGTDFKKKDQQNTSSELLQTLQHRITASLATHTGEYVDKIIFELDKAAGDSRLPRDQKDFHKARKLFIEKRAELIEQWIGHIEEKFAALSPKRARRKWGFFGRKAADDQFQLVEKERFEDWVMVAGIASKLDRQLGSSLFELEGRLSMVSGREIQRELNPLSPNNLLSAFEITIQPYELATLSKKIIYETIEEVFFPALDQTYNTLNLFLIEHGVLLEDEIEEANEKLFSKSDAPIEKREGADPIASGEQGRSWAKRGVLGSLYRMFTPRTPRASTPPPDLADTAIMEPQAPPQQQPQISEKEREVALQALSNVSQDTTQPLEERVLTALQQQAEESGETKPAKLSQEVRGVVRATSGLVTSVSEDQAIDPQLRENMQRLEGPLTKAALSNPESFGQQENPASDLLNDLGKLSVALSSEDPNSEAAKKLKATVQEVVDTLGEEQQATPESFARAQQLVAPLVEQYQKMFSVSARRLVQGQKGQLRLNEARNQIKSLIFERLGDGEPPRIVIETIRHGWDALLVQSHLRQGEKSPNFKLLLVAIERLVQWFSPDRTFPPAKISSVHSLLAAIAKGYEAMPVKPANQARILRTLKIALTHDAKIFEQLRDNRLDSETAYKMIMPGVGEKPQVDTALQAAYERWNGAIDRLNIGDWLVQRKEDGQTRPLSLTHISEQRDAFLLIDGKGAHALDCDQYTLAESLEKIKLLILEDGGLPLVQRAVQRVLKDTYEKMLENSETDSLTGLMNRRAFAKNVERALERLKSEGGHDVLLIVDVDRFKIINDLCGYEGGDRLLVNITHILKTYLDPEAQIARVGDDEFGVLIPHCGQESGFEIAETQRRALENYIFNWHGRRLPISASLGLVLIDDQYASPSDVLKDADSAVYLAKHAGRNTTKIYASDDQAVKWKKGHTQAVSLVEDAIQSGRLQLYMQRISPLFMDGDDPRDRYEILLRMTNRDGEIIKPLNFIEAAAENNRLRTLDRWVIEHFFNWLDEEHQRLDGIGAFCLNLSDQSLFDRGIMELITARLENSPITAERLIFEISEKTFTDNYDKADKAIRKLRSLGCQFSLDNFGKGVASFSYLKEAPVTSVKIDGELIKTITRDESHYALVKSIIEICHFMKKQVTAEMVENEGTVFKLREMDADYIQGYAVGMPFPLAKLFEQM